MHLSEMGELAEMCFLRSHEARRYRVFVFSALNHERRRFVDFLPGQRDETCLLTTVADLPVHIKYETFPLRLFSIEGLDARESGNCRSNLIIYLFYYWPVLSLIE